MTLTSADLRWFSQLVGQLHAHTAERLLFDHLVGALHARFSSFGTVVEEVAYSMATYRLHSGVILFRLPPDYIAGLEDSPMVGRWRALRPDNTLFLSQMVSRTEYHGTTYYNHICRPVRLEDQLVGTFETTPGMALNFSVNRDKLFSVAEWTLMEHTRRHVQACVRRLRPPSSPGLPSEPLELHFDSALQPADLPAAFRSLMTHYFPHARREISEGRLPEAVRNWIRHSVLSLRALPLARPLVCLRTEGPRGHLVLRLFPAPAGGGVTTLRLTEELRVPNLLDLRSRGFTTRECEVLHWVSAGKRDREIGLILGCSARTVTKHVENLRLKTGAETRLAAVHVARRLMLTGEDGSPSR